MLRKIIKFFLENRVVTIILLITFILLGIVYAPFDWNTGVLPHDPIPVDAIPDIGENQQIVSTEWPGRSPKDIDDQITYPLTTALLGIPGVKTIRSTSMFGMSFIYIIFKDNIDFYWSRSRILEKLNSLPAGTLPAGVQPKLGPDATALGQVFWYTLEGRDVKTGKPTGGWDPQELRTIQDFYVKYALSSADGVSEVASVGGYVKEYQVDLDPEAMKAYGVTVTDVMNAVRKSNLDIGAETIELNRVEYIIRGLGYIKNLQDLKDAVITTKNNIPVRVGDVAHISYGPATRRGGLDKDGVEATGGVVVARYGSNPMQVINNVKEKIKEISPGLPSKKLANGTVSRVTIVPFYDRSGLIRETIGTLQSALTHEILISILVIIVLLVNLRASILVSGLLPIGVLMTFIVMKWLNIEANIVALSGIAIAIGVMVDVGIVFVENIIRHLEMPANSNISKNQINDVILVAMDEVSPAIVTALATTVISFLPVFSMQAAEGKLFHPLAFTKTFALIASFVLGIVVLPTLAQMLFSIRFNKQKVKRIWNMILIGAGIFFVIVWGTWLALALSLIGLNNLLENRWPADRKKFPGYINIGIVLFVILYYLTIEWLPLGAANSTFVNFLFVGGTIALILTLFTLMVKNYEFILRWCLQHKWKFMIIPFSTLLFGILIWLGFNSIFGFIAKGVDKIGWKLEQTSGWKAIVKTFPGIGQEFMPSLDEGSFLLMPTSMPNAGVEQSIAYDRQLDRRISAIPEVSVAVGKWGRVNSALDPAPIQMFENTINYKSEYVLGKDGTRLRFKTDNKGNFILKDGTHYNPKDIGYLPINTRMLVPDSHGQYFRQWRPQIKNPNDIWNEIVKAANLPGLTSAPKLQPIQTRLIMLSTGMRAPMGLKIYGPDLQSIEKAGLQFEKILKEVPSIQASSVFYDRSVAAPYIEIKLNREAMARYGMKVSDVQNVLQVALGGMTLTTTVEGRERFPVRVRYARELRSTPEQLKHILIPASNGTQIPLGQIADIVYTKGPQMIRSENTFLTGYVIFDKKEGKAEVNVVEDAQKFIAAKIKSGELVLPPNVTYKFAGNYEQDIRATKRLALVIPISLILIFLLLYFQFKTFTASSIHFSGVFVAFAGGFIMLWLYAQPWFMDFSVAGINIRDMFQMHTINLSVAVWVGFIALFGIATNDGVIMGTYIHQVFEREKPDTIQSVREAVVIAGKQRVRPAMMTAAVAIIALLPVLTSTGKGADIMVPMAIPMFGGMVIQIMTMFVVPILQCVWREGEVRKALKHASANEEVEIQ
ncbi:efflux RND transporter permease subunit [Microbacter margulisiae]|uniref:Cu(I)/Ag(I) efflux system membrane protein CusA/SilA n=1 Tax=Microbacter margulisiae TaxID=1350067 RepID=A0A7W5H0V0_9PORP|nr:efflux RND transporter permease subunit [Microbacter margulisiae]MBB3186080.1 Cu(I)/Ag(I) efflux system membrane protein CusA/SilA [Microbacter margulisiae]